MSLPRGWAAANLGEIAYFIMGQAPPGVDCNTEGIGTPFVKAGEFGPERPLIREWTTRPLKFAHETDILICVVGATAGKLNCGAECAIGRSVAAIRPTQATSAEFLYARMKTEVTRLRSGSTGTAQGVISSEMLDVVAIALPPLAEQRRIVAKLGTLSAHIARARAELERTVLLASNLRAAALRSCFSEEAAQKWPRLTIEEILSEGVIGLVRSKEEQHTTGTPYIRMNHYDLEGRWNSEKLTYVSCTEEEIRRFSLKQGDVLFNTRNSVELVGKVAIWPTGKEGFVYNNNILRMRFCEGVFSEFIGRYMMSPLFQEALAQHKSATTSVAAIYQRSLYKERVPVPPLEEQRAVVKRIESAFVRSNRLEAEAYRTLALLGRLESAIVDKAFKGELLPQDPNDEPASILLDRIRTQRAAAPKAKRGRNAVT